MTPAVVRYHPVYSQAHLALGVTQTHLRNAVGDAYGAQVQQTALSCIARRLLRVHEGAFGPRR
jgi:hypothetical protein